MAGRAFGVKMVGIAEVAAPISQDGVASIQTVGASACIIFTLHQKTQKMMSKDTIVGYHPMGAPTCVRKQEVEKPSKSAAQLYARVQCCVSDDLRADGMQKGWEFWVSTWNVDSLMGRAGEVVEALMDREVDVACIQET